jgi:hypothetical protein
VDGDERLAGMPVPASLQAEADHAVAGELQDRVGDVLARWLIGRRSVRAVVVPA